MVNDKDGDFVYRECNSVPLESTLWGASSVDYLLVNCTNKTGIASFIYTHIFFLFFCIVVMSFCSQCLMSRKFFQRSTEIVTYLNEFHNHQYLISFLYCLKLFSRHCTSDYTVMLISVPINPDSEFRF